MTAKFFKTFINISNINDIMLFLLLSHLLSRIEPFDYVSESLYPNRYLKMIVFKY